MPGARAIPDLQSCVSWMAYAAEVHGQCFFCLSSTYDFFPALRAENLTYQNTLRFLQFFSDALNLRFPPPIHTNLNLRMEKIVGAHLLKKHCSEPIETF